MGENRIKPRDVAAFYSYVEYYIDFDVDVQVIMYNFQLKIINYNYFIAISLVKFCALRSIFKDRHYHNNINFALLFCMKEVNYFRFTNHRNDRDTMFHILIPK